MCKACLKLINKENLHKASKHTCNNPQYIQRTKGWWRLDKNNSYYFSIERSVGTAFCPDCYRHYEDCLCIYFDYGNCSKTPAHFPIEDNIDRYNGFQKIHEDES